MKIVRTERRYGTMAAIFRFAGFAAIWAGCLSIVIVGSSYARAVVLSSNTAVAMSAGPVANLMIILALVWTATAAMLFMVAAGFAIDEQVVKTRSEPPAQP